MEFIEYVKKHRWACIIIFCFVLICHGYFLFGNTLGIDTEINVVDPNESGYLLVGRYGFIFLAHILNTWQCIPNFSTTMAIPLIVLNCIIWSYILFKITNKDNNLIIVIFSIILYSSAIWSSVFYFKVQIFELMICINLITISVYLSYLYLNNKNIIYFVSSILINILCFGTYQATAMIYILGVEFLFILQFLCQNNNDNFKNLILKVFRLFIIFLISFLIYFILNKLFATSDYLSSDFDWGIKSIVSIFEQIYHHIFYVEIGTNVFYTKFFTVFEIIFLFTFIKNLLNKNATTSNKILILIALFGFCLSPFNLTIFLGNYMPIRTQLAYPFVNALFVYYILINLDINNLKNKVTLAFIILCILAGYVQIHNTAQQYYTDHVRYDSDVRIANDLINKINLLQNDDNSIPVVFVGVYHAELNDSCDLSDDAAISFFEHDYYYNYWNAGYGTNVRIISFFKAIGANYKTVSNDEYLNIFNDAQDMNHYPNSESIQLLDNVIVVRLDDYEEE